MKRFPRETHCKHPGYAYSYTASYLFGYLAETEDSTFCCDFPVATRFERVEVSVVIVPLEQT